MFYRLMAALLLTICLALQPATAQNPAPDNAKPEDKVSLTLTDTPLKAVIVNMFKVGGRQYIIDPALDKPPYSTIKVSMNLKDVDFDQALDAITKAHNLSYRREDNMYIIGPGSAQSGTPAASTGEQLITLDLVKVPIATAIETLFRGTGRNYAIDRAVSNPPYDAVLVNLSLKEVPFDTALNALMKSANLVYRKQGVVYLISPKPSTGRPGETTQGVPSIGQETADLVSIVLPPMPVKDALSRLSSGMPSTWEFADGLGNTRMPGVKFYQFPRQMAVAFTIAASGLVPPANNSNRIQTRGDIDIARLFAYEPIATTDPSSTRYYVATGSMRRGPTSESAISIAARRAGNRWLLTLMTDQAFDIDVLEKTFSFAGVSYAIGARSPFSAAKSLSTRLYDVDLDNALNVLLPSVGLTYRKAGTPRNPTYVIADIGTGLQPGMMRSPVPSAPSSR